MTWQAVSSHSRAIQVVDYSHPGASHAAGSRIQPAGNQPSILNLMGGGSHEQLGAARRWLGRIHPFRSHPGTQDTAIQEPARQQDLGFSKRGASLPYQI